MYGCRVIQKVPQVFISFCNWMLHDTPWYIVNDVMTVPEYNYEEKNVYLWLMWKSDGQTAKKSFIIGFGTPICIMKCPAFFPLVTAKLPILNVAYVFVSRFSCTIELSNLPWLCMNLQRSFENTPINLRPVLSAPTEVVGSNMFFLYCSGHWGGWSRTENKDGWRAWWSCNAVCTGPEWEPCHPKVYRMYSWR